MKVELPVGNFPSSGILHSLNSLVEKVAPERFHELDQRIKDVTLTITSSDEWDCKAAKGWELIIMSRKTIEVIWAFSYSYYGIYQSKIAGQQSKGRISLNDDVLTEKRLLTWATDNLIGKRSELMSDVPSPSDACARESINNVAVELALMTTGFYLHHELAHLLYKAHTLDQLEEEKLCDSHAIEWLMLQCPPESRTKRLIGIALGLSLMNVLGIRTLDFDGRTHPLAYDRLIDNLEKYADRDDDKTWGFVLAILAIHMTNEGIQQPTMEFERFYDCVLEYRKIYDRMRLKK